MKLFICLCVSCFTYVTVAAELPTIPSNSPVINSVPAARATDVSSVDTTIAAVYNVISGDVGSPRDWSRMRSLFIPEARIMAVAPKKEGSGFALRLMTLSDYIANAGPHLIETGFHEIELARKTTNWGELTVIMSCYEGKRVKTGEIQRGVNNFQLIFDGSRWWVVSILFEQERSDLTLPEWCKTAA